MKGKDSEWDNGLYYRGPDGKEYIQIDTRKMTRKHSKTGKRNSLVTNTHIDVNFKQNVNEDNVKEGNGCHIDKQEDHHKSPDESQSDIDSHSIHSINISHQSLSRVFLFQAPEGELADVVLKGVGWQFGQIPAKHAPKPELTRVGAVQLTKMELKMVQGAYRSRTRQTVC